MQVTNRKIVSDKGIIEFPKIFLYPFLDLPKEFFEMKRLEMSKNEFKLVTMVLALRNDNKLYSGTIKDMCEFLGIGSDSRNKKNILNALNNLTSQGILRYDVERNFYTIRLDLKCTEKEIIQLDKEWLETIKIYKASTTNTSIDWSNLLKVFLCLIDNNNNIIDSATIARKVDLSCSIVNKALAAIKEINDNGGFGCGFTIDRKPIYQKVSINTNANNIADGKIVEVGKNKKIGELCTENNKNFNSNKTYWSCTGSGISCGYNFK